MAVQGAQILCIAHDFPLPGDNGSSVRALGILRLLVQLGEVRLVVRPRPTTTAAELAAIEAEGIELVLGPVAHPARWRGPSLWLRSLLRRTPPWYVMWHEPALVALAQQQLGWCTHVVALEDFSADYLLHLDIPDSKCVVIDKHKVYAHPPSADEPRTSLFGRLRRAARSPVVAAHERRTLRVADAVVVNTEVEAALFESIFSTRPDAVIPNGVDAVRTWTSRPARSGPPLVLWMGTLDNDWNRRGLLRLLAHLRELPDHGGFELLVAGRGADEAIHQAAEGLPVQVLGFVDDIDPVLETCSAAVIPVWAGGGGRVKSLVLLGSGIPVVATPAALDGTDAVDGVHCLVADTVEGLVMHLRALFADPLRAAEMGGRGHDLVASRHGWQSRLPDLRRVLALE